MSFSTILNQTTCLLLKLVLRLAPSPACVYNNGAQIVPNAVHFNKSQTGSFHATFKPAETALYLTELKQHYIFLSENLS